MKKPASVDVIKFVSRLQKAVEARQQTSKVEMPDKNDQKKRPDILSGSADS